MIEDQDIPTPAPPEIDTESFRDDPNIVRENFPVGGGPSLSPAFKKIDWMSSFFLIAPLRVRVPEGEHLFLRQLPFLF